MTVLEELQRNIRRLAEDVGPSVVSVGAGAGIVIDTGQVLTNAHNLRGREVDVAFPDGRAARGTVAGADVDGDLAIIAVDTGAATPVTWSEDGAGLGAPVFALAGTRTGGTRVTFGTIAATDRSFRGPRGRLIRDAIEHTAPLARGSSGGPVVDADGRLVGINTHRRGDGFYLAVPASAELRSRLERLGRGDEPGRPRLGIAVAPAAIARRMRAAVGLDDREGLLVRDVDPDGPAGRAGIRRGDLIVGTGDASVGSSDDLFALLDGLQEGASLTLRVVRGTEEVTVAVTFGPAREEGSA